jgi:TolB-like protein
MSLLAELRRRQVFRAAAWYGGLAWAAIEIANTVFPQFGLPSWSVRAVIVVAVLAFPVVLVLAWFLDVSLSGIRREADVSPAASAGGPATGSAAAAPAAAWRSPSLWIALALGVGLTLSAQQAWQRLVRPAGSERPSIAVLPFANLSPDEANAFFADGLHEEILASLARAGGLRVISRTSVQEYRDSRRNLREIADALEVTHILEGSVRRDGDDLRLSLQLIDGRSDEHLWAETYDREFRDVLQLQRTVAQQVASEIGAKLSRAERRLIAGAAPAVAEAYEPYLRALALWNQHATDEEHARVEALLDQSVRRDPTFALAYALRAKLRIWRMQHTDPPNEQDILQLARADIDRALELFPGLPEALTASGLYHTYVARDPRAAVDELTRALAAAPSDPDAHNVLGLTLRRLGRFGESVDHFREAARLTPGQERYAYRTFETLEGLGRLDEAEQDLAAFERRFPSRVEPRLARFRLRFLRTGETAGWREEYDRLAQSLDGLNRTYHASRVMLATGDLAGLATFLEAAEMEDEAERPYYLGLVYAALGQHDRARPHLLAVADAARRNPADALSLVDGAVASSLLGQHEEAMHLADEAVRLLPESQDAVNGRHLAALRSWVLIHSRARAEEGYAEFERLLGGFRMLPRTVAVDLPWVLLRDDERVQQIIRSKLPR